MRWKCTVAYDGTGLHGWQSQPGGNTVQDILENRLKTLFGQPIRIHGSGRTDSGVHARGQVFHFDGQWSNPQTDLLNALRSGLPESIQVSSVRSVSPDFHARYSATGKRYIYWLYEGYAPPMETRYFWSLGRRKLNIDLMNETAALLLGKHDFSAFGAERGDGSPQNPVKDLRRLEITRKGRRIRIATEASGYLYKMVRSLVGALVDVGIEKLPPDELVNIFKSHKRTQLIVTVPARGLCLEKVFY